MLAVTEIRLDPQLIALLTGAVVPLLVSLLTKLNAARQLKAVLNLGLSALAGGLATIAVNGVISNWETWLEAMTVAWASSIMTYFGLWEPTAVAFKLGRATATFGLGPRRHPKHYQHGHEGPVEPVDLV